MATYIDITYAREFLSLSEEHSKRYNAGDGNHSFNHGLLKTNFFNLEWLHLEGHQSDSMLPQCKIAICRNNVPWKGHIFNRKSEAYMTRQIFMAKGESTDIQCTFETKRLTV